MKCPECGQWNRASMPHCVKCGAPLNIDEASRLQWKDKLKDSGPSTAYLRADEFGRIPGMSWPVKCRTLKSANAKVPNGRAS